MGYNKNQFTKVNDKKVLHKVKKQWVVLSLAMFMAIGGASALTHTTASANDRSFNDSVTTTSSANQHPQISNPESRLHQDTSVSQQTFTQPVHQSQTEPSRQSQNVGEQSDRSKEIQHPNGSAKVTTEDGTYYYYFLQYDTGGTSIKNYTKKYPMIIRTAADSNDHYDPYNGFKLNSGNIYDNQSKNKTYVNPDSHYVELYRKSLNLKYINNFNIPAKIDFLSGNTGQSQIDNPNATLDKHQTESRSYAAKQPVYVGEPIAIHLDKVTSPKDHTTVNNQGYTELDNNMTAVAGEDNASSFWLPREVHYTYDNNSHNNNNPAMKNAPTNNQPITKDYFTTKYLLESNLVNNITINYYPYGDSLNIMATETLPWGSANDKLSANDYNLNYPQYFYLNKNYPKPDWTYRTDAQRLNITASSSNYTYQLPYYAQELDRNGNPIKDSLKLMHYSWTTNYAAYSNQWYANNSLPLPNGEGQSGLNGNGIYILDGQFDDNNWFNAFYDPKTNHSEIDYTIITPHRYNNAPLFYYVLFKNGITKNLLTKPRSIQYGIYDRNLKDTKENGEKDVDPVYGNNINNHRLSIQNLISSIQYPKGSIPYTNYKNGIEPINNPNQVPLVVPDGTQMTLKDPGGNTFGNWPYAGGEWTSDRPNSITITFHRNSAPTYYDKNDGKNYSGSDADNHVFYHLWADEGNYSINFVNQINQTVASTPNFRWYGQGSIMLDPNYQLIYTIPATYQFSLYKNNGQVPADCLGWHVPKGYHLDMTRQRTDINDDNCYPGMPVYIIGDEESFIARRKSDGAYIWVHGRVGDLIPGVGHIEPNNGLENADTVDANEAVLFQIRQLDANGNVMNTYSSKQFSQPFTEEVLTDFTNPHNFNLDNSALSGLVNYANTHWQGYHLATPQLQSQVVPRSDSVPPVTWDYVPNTVKQTEPVVVVNEDPKANHPGQYTVTGMHKVNPDPSFSGLVGQTKTFTPNDLTADEIKNPNKANLVYHPDTGGFTLAFNASGGTVQSTANVPSTITFGKSTYNVVNGKIQGGPYNGCYPFIYKSPSTKINVTYQNQTGQTVGTDTITGSPGAAWNGNKGSYNYTPIIDGKIPNGYNLDTSKGNQGYSNLSSFPASGQPDGQLTVYVKGQSTTASNEINVVKRHYDTSTSQWVDDSTTPMTISVNGNVGDEKTLNHNTTPISGSNTLDALESGYTFDNQSDPMTLQLNGNSSSNWTNLSNGHTVPYEYYDLKNNVGVIQVNYVNANDNTTVATKTVSGQSGTNFDSSLYTQNRANGGFIPSGWTYDSQKAPAIPSQFNTSTQQATVYVKPQASIGHITVKYRDMDNTRQQIGPSYTTDGTAGSDFNYSQYEATPPNGYAVVRTTGYPTQYNDGTQTWTIGVKKLSKIHVVYKNSQDQVVGNQSTAAKVQDTSFNIRPFMGSLPNGYVLDKTAHDNWDTNANYPTSYTGQDQNAVIYIKSKSGQPNKPVRPNGPSNPVSPNTPSGPNNPNSPINPVNPVGPINPIQPVTPVGPRTPTPAPKDQPTPHSGPKVINKKGLNKLAIGETGNYHGHDITRMAVNSHFKYFWIIKTCLVHTDPLFNNRNYVSVLKHRQYLTIPIHKVFMVHYRKANRIRYEINWRHQLRFVTGDRYYTPNSYWQKSDVKARHSLMRVYRECCEYTSPHYSRRTLVRTLRPGTSFKIKRVIYLGAQQHYQTRFELTNGHYVTANKNFVGMYYTSPVQYHFKYFRIAKPVALYQEPVFRRHDAVKVWTPKLHLTIPIQKVIKNQQGVRYQIRLHGRHYYVTGDSRYTPNAYVQPHELRQVHGAFGHYYYKARLIRGAREYKQPNYNRRTFVKDLRKGQVLHIKRVVPIGGKDAQQTRFQLMNGHYVTSNKNFVKLI